LVDRAALFALRAIGRIPFPIRSAIGAAHGYLIGLLPLREAKIASLQLAAFLPELKSRSMTPRVFANLGRSLFESINLAPLTQAPFPLIACANWGEVKAWVADSRPIIALTGHIGNWDLLAAYVIAQGVPVATVGREARNPHMQLILRAMREAYGIETIWRSDKNGIKRIVQCLKERKVMAALIDQDTRVDSCFVPFFGTPAKTPSALIELGIRYNARFISAFMVRRDGGGFEALIREIDAPKERDAILCRFHAYLEETIRAHPTQWAWVHKRWRTSPTAETLSTKQYISALERKISPSR
jgi:KDO2-lipid IV(A) lauroyltransferase